MKEAIPNLSRVAVLWNPKSTDNELQWKESQVAAAPATITAIFVGSKHLYKYERSRSRAARLLSASTVQSIEVGRRLAEADSRRLVGRFLLLAEQLPGQGFAFAEVVATRTEAVQGMD